MKTFLASLPLALLLAFFPALSASSQSSAFSYQGELAENGVPAQGSFDFQFSLFGSPTGKTQVGETLIGNDVQVTDGLFTLMLDFGADAWNGLDRWIEVGVRPGGSSLAFETLQPRQPVTSVPHAIRAETAGGVPAGAITSAMLADGAVSGSKLAPESAAANLAGSGLSSVASGGILLSERPFATNLVEQGFQRLGQLDLVPESWRTLTNGPPLADFEALARREFAAVWTGTELIVWGGGTEESGPVNTGGRYNPVTSTWTRMSVSNAPSPQLAPGAVWTGTHMIVWGNSGPVRGGRYDPSLDSWLPLSEAGAPEPRLNHPLVWSGTHLIIWGGSIGNTASGTGARYDPGTDLWSPVSGTGAPAARDFHSAVWTGSRMLVWGGKLTVSCGFLCTRVTNYNDGFLYNPANNSWSPISTVGAPLRRFGHTAIWTGAEMFVWGGNHGQGEGALVASTNLNSGTRYNLANNSWSTITTTGAPSPRDSHAAHWTGSEMLIYGGDNGQPDAFGDGALYRATGNSWRPISTVEAPPTRIGHQTVWTGTEMLVWGGVEQNEPGTFDDKLVEVGRRYDPALDAWSRMAPSGEPAARRDHTAVWAETEMLVWGGHGGEFALRSGGRLDPSAPPPSMWALTSLENVPAARSGQSAVWTGNEMLIWGGTDGSHELNTGGRYRPVNNTWTRITTNDAPVARQSHAAVWTGDSLLIWGGFGSSSYLNTGGIYRPEIDSWQPIPTLNAPSARARATAVWTGSDLIVWGGEVVLPGPVTSYLATGGRFNPASGLWQPLPLENAPEARSGHTAVWTGAELIVWGGETASGLAQTGGRFDPITGIWRPLPPANAPSARTAHTAVWAGTQMLIWGGSDGIISLNTGGRFDPLQGTWAPITTTGAALLRQNHTAVWSGTEMIIWGGVTDTGGTVSFRDDAYAYIPPRRVFLYLKP